MLDNIEPEPLGIRPFVAAAVPVEVASRRAAFDPKEDVSPPTADADAEPFAGMGASAGLASEAVQLREDARQDTKAALLN